MDEARLLALAVARAPPACASTWRLDARAALHGQAGGLVEDEDVVVLEEDDRAEESRVVGPAPGEAAARSRAGGPPSPGLIVTAAGRGIGLVLIVIRRMGSGWGGSTGERRDAHRLPGLQPHVGLDAAAIDPNLAGTQQLLQVAEGRVRGSAS